MNKDNAKDYLPLVQALAEGKTVQLSDGRGGWIEGEIEFHYPASEYRIKPEPREIFFVEFASGNRGPYATREIAEEAYPRCKITAYREVLE